jgi:hypothetical protein
MKRSAALTVRSRICGSRIVISPIIPNNKLRASCSRKLSKSGVVTATGPRLPRNPTSTRVASD